MRRGLLGADALGGLLGGLLAAPAAGLTSGPASVLPFAIASVWVATAFVCGLYEADDARVRSTGAGVARRLMVASLLMSWPAYALLGVLDASRPGLGALVAAFATAASAGIARAVACAALRRAPRLRQRVVIVGSGEVSRRLVERLRLRPELGLDPVGFVDDDVRAGGAPGIEWLGRLESLGDVLAAGDVDRVMLAFTRSGHEDLLRCLRVCRDAAVAVDVVPRLFEFLDGARTTDALGGMPLMSIEPAVPSMAMRCGKRALDVAGSALGLIVLAPLMAAIAVAVRVESPGPVVFVQPRSGRRGRFFALYKFRSMRDGSTVETRDCGAIVKHADDPRVTRVGRFLRRYSLDELPQLLNVLKGDMSLVGPRPLVRDEHEALTEAWQRRRADLRPGLTGPWQVAGRSHLPFWEMIRLDYQYVAGWSLARDLEILLATVPAVLSGRGAV